MGRSEGKAVPLYPPLKHIHIELHWTDNGQSIKTFDNGHQFADFLRENPILNAAVFPGEKLIAPSLTSVETVTKVLCPPLRSADLSLFWYDMKYRGGKTFKTVHELAAFLRANPELAQALGYVAKK